MPITKNTTACLPVDDQSLLNTYLELIGPTTEQSLLAFMPANHPALEFLTTQGLKPKRGQIDEVRLPYDDESFDHVLGIRPALITGNAQGFASEAARIVRPGGMVAVIVFDMPKNRKAARYVNALLRFYDPQHNWAYSLPRWSGIFKQAGLAKTHSRSQATTHHFVDWLAKADIAPETALKLEILLRQAPEKAQNWLNTTVRAAGDVTFMLQSGLLVGRK